MGGASGKLELAEQESLVLIRQERGGEMEEEVGHRRHDGAVDHQVANRLAKGTADDPFIFAAAELEYAVEPAEEPGKPAGLAGMVPLFDRLEQGGAEGRGQDHAPPVPTGSWRR